MSDKGGRPRASAQRYIGDMVGMSYPQVEEVPGVSDAFRRRWILRLTADLPEPEAIDNLVKSLEATLRRDISKALGIIGTLESHVPSASAVRLDEHHLILAIDCPSSAAKMGDAAAIATWGILKAADDHWQLEDLQGIPKRYWFAMR